MKAIIFNLGFAAVDASHSCVEGLCLGLLNDRTLDSISDKMFLNVPWINNPTVMRKPVVTSCLAPLNPLR